MTLAQLFKLRVKRVVQAGPRVQGVWETWFAWYPVTLLCGRVTWLNTVERQRGWRWHYVARPDRVILDPDGAGLYAESVTRYRGVPRAGGSPLLQLDP